MALTIKRAIIPSEPYSLVRLVDSVNDNPLELTLARMNDGSIGVLLEDRDAGTTTNTLVLGADELRAALAVLDVPRGVYIED